MKWKSKKMLEKLEKNVYVLILSAGIVLIWRGIWGMLDLYLLPENLVLSYVVSILLGVGILYFHNHDLDELVEVEDEDVPIKV